MLVSRNVTIGALRTSMRLEPEFWAALKEIAHRGRMTLDDLCSEVDARRGTHSRTAAMRLFATAYFATNGATALDRMADRLGERRDAPGASHPTAVVATTRQA